MNTLALHLRPVVRSTLAFQPAQWFTSSRVLASVRHDQQWFEAKLADVIEALQWSADQGYAEREFDRDLSTPESITHRWRITEAGMQKVKSEL